MIKKTTKHCNYKGRSEDQFGFDEKMVCTLPKITRFLILWSNGHYGGGGHLTLRKFFPRLMCWYGKHNMLKLRVGNGTIPDVSKDILKCKECGYEENI